MAEGAIGTARRALIKLRDQYVEGLLVDEGYEEQVNMILLEFLSNMLIDDAYTPDSEVY